MISTSYDLDDTNQRNSSASIIDEESIFLSSSSDEDLPLSSRFNVSSGTSIKNLHSSTKHRYMETMINDGLGADENTDDSNLSEEAMEQVSEEDDDEVEYIPTTTYTEEGDDDIEEVSEEEENEKPTSIYDEYDPENLDHFNASSLLKDLPPKYEPTRLNQSSEDDNDDEQEDSPEATKPTRKVRHTRSTAALAEPGLKPKRKYVRKPAEAIREEVATAVSAKRPYNNANRTRSSVEKKNKQSSSSVQSVQRELKKAKIVSNDMTGVSQSSPNSSGNGSDTESVESKESEEGRTLQVKKPVKQVSGTGLVKKKTPIVSSAAVQPDATKLKTKTSSNSPANVISGRIINLSSGFKIPKRPSNEASSDKNSSVPPEKKPRTVSEELTSSAVSKSAVSNQQKISKPALDKTSAKPSSSSSSTSVTKSSVPKESSKTTAPTALGSHPKVSKPKKAELKESDLFMDALGPSTHSARPKPKPVAKLHPATASSRKTAEPETSKTITTSGSLSNSTISNSSSQLTLNQYNSTILANLNARASDHSNSDANSATAQNGEPKSNLTEPGLKKANKRKVIWADHHSKQLENISFYELDETEREIKKNAFKGGDMAKIEKLNEKEMKFKHHDSYDIADPLSDPSNEAPWPTLIPIDLPDSTHQPTICSAEHDIQVAREMNILGVLMFKEFLPDSPSEPTDSVVDHSLETIVSKLIPLEDVTLNQSSSDIEINHVPEEINPSSSHTVGEPVSAEIGHKSSNYSPTDTFSYRSNGPSDQHRNTNHHHHSSGKNHNAHHHNNYYNKSHHQQHFRHQQQEEQNLRKEPPIQPNKLFTPASPPITTKPTATVTPLSPTRTTTSAPSIPKLYSKLVEDSPETKEPDVQATPAPDASNLLSLSSSLLSSNEMTEKIKQILNQINCTSSTVKPEEAGSERQAVVSEPSKLMSLTEIELPPAFTGAIVAKPAADEYTKGASGKWSTPSSNYNSNKSYGSNNNYNNNNSSQKSNNEFNSNRNNNNTGNNRNQFSNNFRRGIGHRTNNDNNSNFNQRNSYSSSNNNNNSNNNSNNSNNNNDNYGYQNNKFNSRSGGNGRYNNSNGNKNYQSRFDNANQKNDSRFNHNSNERPGYNRNFNKDSNFENDSPPKNANTSNKPSANATVSSTTGKGAWI